MYQPFMYLPVICWFLKCWSVGLLVAFFARFCVQNYACL